MCYIISYTKLNLIEEKIYFLIENNFVLTQINYSFINVFDIDENDKKFFFDFELFKTKNAIYYFTNIKTNIEIVIITN